MGPVCFCPPSRVGCVCPSVARCRCKISSMLFFPQRDTLSAHVPSNYRLGFFPVSQLRKRKGGGGGGGGASDSTSPVRGNDAKRKRVAASPSNGEEGTPDGDTDAETEQSGADRTEKEGAAEEVSIRRLNVSFLDGGIFRGSRPATPALQKRTRLVVTDSEFSCLCAVFCHLVIKVAC